MKTAKYYFKRTPVNSSQNKFKERKNEIDNSKEARTSFYKSIIIYAVVSLFLFFEMAVQVSPSVMSTQLMSDFGISAFGLGIMSGFYFYTYTAMQIPSGFLLDRYCPRLVITSSILVCSIGTLIFSFADNVYFGSLARLLMGTGSAFAFISVLVVTADLFQSKYFAVFAGLTQMLAAFGAMAGQMPIGILVSDIGWRSTMLLLSVIGIILAILVWSLVTYTRVKPKPRSENPNVSIKSAVMEVISKPQTWLVALYSCLLWAPMSGFASLWGVPFLETVDHLTKNEAAILCSLMWLGLAIASPVLGMISTFAKNRVYPLIFSALIGVVSFGFILEFSFSKEVLGILLILAGASCAGQALSFAVVKENNSSLIKATAIAFNNMAVVISGAIFQPVIGKLISSDFVNGVAISSVSSFKSGVSILFIAYLIAFFIAVFFIRETNCDSYKLAVNDYQCG